MSQFYETYECKIDDKGRVKLPSQLVKYLEETTGKTFVVKRSVFQKCLEVYPVEAWEKIMVQVNGLNRFIKKNADFIRMFTAGVKKVELDASERLLVPKDLKIFAELTKEIVVSGIGDFFEIWDKNAYEMIIQTTQGDFVKLTEEVMGELANPNN